MSKRSIRRSSKSVGITTADLDPAIVAMIEPVTDPITEPVTVPVPEPEPEPLATTSADDIRTYHANAGYPMPDGWIPSPSHVGLIAAIRIVVPGIVRPIDTTPMDYDAVVRAFETAFDVAGLPPYNPATPNTTRVGGLGITDAQNVVYHACAISGVFVPDDVVACVWASIAPRARCRYTTTAIAKRYATSTLSAYMRGDHGGNPMVSDAVNVIRPWYVAGGVTRAPKPTT
jgi:hypothetical protein